MLLREMLDRGFSTASLAYIDGMVKEREEKVKLMLKVHTENLTEAESEFMSKYLTTEQVDQIEQKVMANCRFLLIYHPRPNKVSNVSKRMMV
jgi:hypothetical protein